MDYKKTPIHLNEFAEKIILDGYTYGVALGHLGRLLAYVKTSPKPEVLGAVMGTILGFELSKWIRR